MAKEEETTQGRMVSRMTLDMIVINDDQWGSTTIKMDYNNTGTHQDINGENSEWAVLLTRLRDSRFMVWSGEGSSSTKETGKDWRTAIWKSGQSGSGS